MIRAYIHTDINREAIPAVLENVGDVVWANGFVRINCKDNRILMFNKDSVNLVEVFHDE